VNETPAASQDFPGPSADPEISIDLGDVVERAVNDDVPDATDVADVARRIAVDEHEIGELPRLDRADLLVEPHHARRAERHHLQHPRRPNAGPHVQLELAMEGESRTRLPRRFVDRIVARRLGWRQVAAAHRILTISHVPLTTSRREAI
jgi:hypothetical protein